MNVIGCYFDLHCFRCDKGAGRQTERLTGARAGGRTGSNATGQLMILIYLNTFFVIL